jgi:phosphoglycolate phosphatase
MNTVIFDLDGTLSDSAEGIVKSINYALPKLGYNELPEKDLLQYIGPPLNTIIERITGKNDEEFLLKGVKTFRERYFSIGYKENELYDGIKGALGQLTERGDILCIATAKRKDIAENVLRFFKIEKYFTQVHGSDLYRKKTDLLTDMINDSTLNDRPMVMIGDRDSDFMAAREVGMPSLAVRWGYGNEEEFKLATAIVERPRDLPEAISKNACMVK